jgi:hypothetical protein
MTTMYESEREAIRDFLDRVFGGFADQAFEGIRRSWTPVLPDDPDDAQRNAYAELAGLARDPEFRATMRRSAEMFAEDRARSGIETAHPDAVTLARQGRALNKRAAPKNTAAVVHPPGLADRNATAKTAHATAAVVHPPRLVEQMAAADDPRRQRYESLLATVNGWGPDPARGGPGLAAA